MNAHGWADTLGLALNRDEPLRIVVGAPLTEHGARLMASMGVEVEIRAGQPTYCECCSSPLSGRMPPKETRAELSDEARERMRVAYFKRPDKARMA